MGGDPAEAGDNDQQQQQKAASPKGGSSGPAVRIGDPEWFDIVRWVLNVLIIAEELGGDLETGTVFMNRCDYLDPALAWTGVKQTGRGATLSRIGYEHLTRPKSFHLRHAG